MEMFKQYRILVPAALGTLALIGGAVGMTGSASAAPASEVGVTGTNAVAWTLDDNPGGRATFWADDEILDVCDAQEDGLRVWGSLTWKDSSGSHSVSTEDANGSKPFDRCAVKDVNIPEGTKVTVRACLKNGASGAHRFCFSSTGTA